jgi:hypothetical protein
MTCRRSIADALPIPPQRRRLRLSRQRRALGARSNQISCKRQTAGKRAKQARNPIASARDRALQSRIYRPITQRGAAINVSIVALSLRFLLLFSTFGVSSPTTA